MFSYAMVINKLVLSMPGCLINFFSNLNECVHKTFATVNGGL